MQDLPMQVEKFVAHLNQMKKDEWKTRNYTHSNPPTHRADYISKKWIRVVVVETINNVLKDNYVYCFISREDGLTNKTLGQVKMGDIHKAASYKAPAKHARGNVFDELTWTCAGPYGISYLR